MKQIDKLILCSPYREPHLHWERDKQTQEFLVIDSRRRAGYTIASPERKTGEVEGKFIELPLVNLIRKRIKEWRTDGRPGLTGITVELLKHWEDNDQRTHPFFFCQLEAIEAIIFLIEAPDHYKTGINIPSDGGGFVRWCNKMATGSGKTTVMAMLIAYNILNKVSYKQDNRFSKHILVVAPGLTVKSRLSVLYPSDDKNYYKEFNVVPTTLMDYLRQGSVKVINWHMLAWDTQDKLDEKAEKRQLRSVDKRKFIEISDTAYARSILGEMAKASNILVINDEAHHAWRTAAESKEKQVKREDIDNTVWIGGLDKLNRQVNILRCHDFSATPFTPTGKKANEIGLFDWIISDFGLTDAIETGLIKTPRVVFRDDGKLTAEYKSKLYHLYIDDDVKEDLNQKQVPKETPLPDLVKNAYNLLGTDWQRTRQEWIKKGIGIPPVMITIANTTITSERIKHYFDSGECEIKELCEIDKTLQIDSQILSQLENEDENLRGSRKELAEALREKVSTVGKVGKPGEKVQNVISVSMLSEGWDAKNVTQIMGLRAFSSQLLCEQVVGRGLRRVAYDFDRETQMLEPEYVNIFGVPFSFIPHEGGAVSSRPAINKIPIEPVAEKKEYQISFPNILRIDAVYKSSLQIEYDSVKPIVIDPDNTITEAELSGAIQGDITPAAMTQVDIKKFDERYRLQSVVFRVATNIYGMEKNNWRGNKYDFLSQLLKLTEEFLQSQKIVIKSHLFNQDKVRRNILLTLNISRIIQHFWMAIKDQNAEILTPVFDSERPIRSTSDMPTWYTSKPNFWHDKSHVNFTVFDSTWEANNANIIDKHDAVRAFVKNDHLGFSIKYNFRGIIRSYIPDYLIELKNGDKLILEVKGQDNDENRVKREFLNLWVKAVNETGQFGEWHWAVVFNSFEIHDILEKYREFPVESFLPANQEPSADEIVVQNIALSGFYGLDIQTLEREDSLEGKVKLVMRHLLTSNIQNILQTIRSASSDPSGHFVDDDEKLQTRIYEVLDGITPVETDTYEGRVRGYLKEAKKLEKLSLSFLISAEYINDTLVKQMSDDFSPYVLQLSRSVEYELLQKLFVPFTNYTRALNPHPGETYKDDLYNKQTSLFAKMVANNQSTYTLGNMFYILCCLRDALLVEKSLILNDFHLYIIDNHSKDLYSKEFLDDLNELLNKFRNKSAHTEIIPRDKAAECKFVVRKVLARILTHV